MARTAWKLIAALSLASLLWGCTAPPQPKGPTVERVTIASPAEYEALWDSTTEVLRKKMFRLDRQDRQAGVITTLPETAGAGWECWRPQSSDPYYWAEDNAHTIQRQVTVRMNEVAEPDEYELDVEVQRRRFRLEERRITNAAGALRLYSGAAPTYSGEMELPEESAYWIPIGRDGVMEEELLKQIVEQYRFDRVAGEAQADAHESRPE